MPNLYKDYTRADVENVDGGYKPEVKFAPKSTLVTEALPLDDGTLGAAVRIVDDHEFGVDDGFISHELVEDSVSLTSKPVGEPGYQSQEHTLVYEVAGDGPELQDQLSKMENDKSIFLVKDQNCKAATAYVQLGDSCTTPKVSVEFNSGTTKEGIKKHKVTAVVRAKKFWYEGIVTDKPA